MWIWTQIRNAAGGDLRGNLRPISVRTPLVLVGAFAVGFLVPPVFAQLPGVPNGPPPPDPQRSLDRIQTRNTPHDLSAAQKSLENDTCLLAPLTLVHSPTVAATDLQTPAKA